MRSTLANLAGFQAGWFACVLGAAEGMPALGVAVVAALAAGRWLIAPNRHPEAALFAASAALGYALDSVLVLAGVMAFPPQAQLGGPPALWMVALWVNLSLTLNGALRWLGGRWALSALLGAVAGPLAYWAGDRLGAVVLASGAGALAAIAAEWAAALPLMLVLNRWLQRKFAPAPAARVAAREEAA